MAGVKIDFGQLLGLLQSRRQRNAADPARGLVVLPAGADQVAAHHRLDGQCVEPPRDHRATFGLRPFGRVRQHRGQRPLQQVVADQVGGPAEPEIRDGGQDAALAWDRVRQDHVEGRKAIGGDDQQTVGIDGIDIANLAAM